MSEGQLLHVGDYVRVTNIATPEDEPWLRIGDEGVVIDIHFSPRFGAIPVIRFFDNPERELALLLYKGDAVEIIEKSAVMS